MSTKNNDSNQRRIFWTRSTILFTSFAFLFLTIASTRSVWAASQSSGVVEALQKKYALTQMTPDYEQVTKDGMTMDLKSAGIYSLPTSDMIEPDNKVADGKIQPPSMFTKLTLTKMGSHVLQNGDKVYITKIDRKDESGDVLLRFTIVTVSALDVTGQDAQKKYKAIVAFKFKKGYLDDAPPDEVEQAVETIMAPDTGDDSSQGGDNSANAGQAQGPQQQAPPPAPRQAAAPPPPPAPAGPPPTISIGESSTEVLQAMGMPLQMIDLGKKKTYVYKNMKVIFLNDKVSDVQ
jgi:hypothetical protein